MNKSVILSQLEDLGLEEAEAKIYLHLLESGSRTHLELSRETNINRSKIYRSVEKLTEKKLLEEINTFSGKKIQAVNPKNIGLLIEEEQELLNSRKTFLGELVEQLNGLPTYVQREFEVKHYRGQEGLRQMLWNQLHAKKEILAFSYKNKNDIVGKSYAEKIRTEQVERKITLFEIENETDQGDYWYTDVPGWGEFYQSRHIKPTTLEIKQYIAIFNNTVAIINWSNGEEIGVEIINSHFADMQKQLFRKFWEIANKKPNPKTAGAVIISNLFRLNLP